MTYSAIIVLGNLMSKSGNLNIESCSRMDVAIKAFNENLAPYIITSGWAYREDSPIAIADAMKKYAIEIRRVLPESVLVEKNARDTVGDAIFTKKNIVLERVWNKLLVVTSDYHVSRTCKIFNYVYGGNFTIDVIGASTNKAEELLESEMKSINAFHETFMDIKVGNDRQIYRRLREKHPYYNGVVYSQIKED